MRKFKNEVVLIDSEEKRDFILKECRALGWELGKFVSQLNCPFYLYRPSGAKRFNGITTKYDTDEEISFEKFKLLL